MISLDFLSFCTSYAAFARTRHHKRPLAWDLPPVPARLRSCFRPREGSLSERFQESSLSIQMPNKRTFTQGGCSGQGFEKATLYGGVVLRRLDLVVSPDTGPFPDVRVMQTGSNVCCGVMNFTVKGSLAFPPSQMSLLGL